MSTTQIIDWTDLIYGLKAAATALECRHSAPVSRDREKEQARCRTASPNVCITKQPACPKKEKFRRRKPACGAAAPLSLKDSPLTKARCKDKERKKIDRCLTSRLVFPEMRGGVLYAKCYCLHRNGLQDHCPLSQCQGQPECLVRPWAVCPPGKFVRLRYPELYPDGV